MPPLLIATTVAGAATTTPPVVPFPTEPLRFPFQPTLGPAGSKRCWFELKDGAGGLEDITSCCGGAEAKSGCCSWPWPGGG